MKDSVIKPSRWYYGLAILILISGNLVSSWFFLRDYSYLEKYSHRVVVPGEHIFELNTPGSYTIFYEYRSAVGNRIFSTSSELIPDLKCFLFDKSGAEISLTPRLGNERYFSSNGPSGISLFNFKIDAPGTYTLKVIYGDGREKPEVVLAVREGFTRRAMRMIGITGFILLATIGLAGYIAYKTFVKRRHFKK